MSLCLSSLQEFVGAVHKALNINPLLSRATHCMDFALLDLALMPCHNTQIQWDIDSKFIKRTIPQDVSKAFDKVMHYCMNSSTMESLEELLQSSSLFNQIAYFTLPRHLMSLFHKILLSFGPIFAFCSVVHEVALSSTVTSGVRK